MKINIKKLDADAVLPTRGSSQAAGYDLYAKSSEDTVIPPHKTVMVLRWKYRKDISVRFLQEAVLPPSRDCARQIVSE